MPITDELARLIDRNAGSDGVHATAIPRLHLIRSSCPTEAIHAVHEPAVCLVAQGRKRVMLGERIYDYDRARYLVVSIDVPIVGQIIEADPAAPYLCLRLDLDPTVLATLLVDSGAPRPPDAAPGSSLVLSDVTPELLDAATRLVRLLDQPRDIAMLGPLIEREILYRLLNSDQAPRLHQIAHGESRLQQVNRAIGWIKRHFREPFRMEALAAAASMSPSALHQHFKTVTAMSPLQYQKQLRLQEARRLILASAMDAAMAGHTVGYDSPSQFSRDYRRVFGAPPIRDVAALKARPELMMNV